MQHDPNVVLGIDAAWTDKQPSGVALLKKQGARWCCLRSAPSYDAFCKGFHWTDNVSGSAINASELLKTCQNLSGGWPGVIAVDMPLSNERIEKRRRADNDVSKRFGPCKCAVHSPNPQRPGRTGRRLQEGFCRADYSLVTQKDWQLPALIEVYPHVALLGLAHQETRLPYKVNKTNTYWPNSSLDERKQILIKEWKQIIEYLNCHIDKITVKPPKSVAALSLQYLKRYEDAIDALVCAWMAIQLIENAACPMGDASAAIWIPVSSMESCKV